MACRCMMLPIVPSDPDSDLMSRAVRELHGCESVHVGVHAVEETFQGLLVWEGEVHELELLGHRLERAYAWPLETEAGRREVVVVLAEGPVVDPVTAVQASIVAEERAKGRA